MSRKDPYGNASQRIARFLSEHSERALSKRKPDYRKRGVGVSLKSENYPSSTRWIMGYQFEDHSARPMQYGQPMPSRVGEGRGWHRETGYHRLARLTGASGKPRTPKKTRGRATYVYPRAFTDKEEYALNRRKTSLPLRAGQGAVREARAVREGYDELRQETQEKGATPLPEPSKLWQAKYVTPKNIGLYGGKIVGGIAYLEKKREERAVKQKQEKALKDYREAQIKAQQTRYDQAQKVLNAQNKIIVNQTPKAESNLRYIAESQTPESTGVVGGFVKSELGKGEKFVAKELGSAERLAVKEGKQGIHFVEKEGKAGVKFAEKEAVKGAGLIKKGLGGIVHLFKRK